MERLWSPAGATSGNHRQFGWPPKPRKQAKSVAMVCDWLPRASNGKEGVDGSSPSEGSAKSLLIAAFSVGSTCTSSSMRSDGAGYGAGYGAFSSETASGKRHNWPSSARIVLRRPSAVGRSPQEL
jgi:hypothetical protein